MENGLKYVSHAGHEVAIYKIDIKHMTAKVKK